MKRYTFFCKFSLYNYVSVFLIFFFNFEYDQFYVRKTLPFHLSSSILPKVILNKRYRRRAMATDIPYFFGVGVGY